VVAVSRWAVLAFVVGAFAFPVFATAAPVPSGFFGVVPQGTLGDRDFARMQGTIGSVRLALYWGEVEPRRGAWDFAAMDEQIAAAARHGIRVMPYLYGTAPWLSADPTRPPTSSRQQAQWIRFVRRAVGRYGAGGEFWRGRANRLSVRHWQVWNEPNFSLFWSPRPDPRRYVGLLAASARAIRSLDPGAVVVAAAVAPVAGGMPPARFLAEMYATPGAKRWFDVAALHPYASRVSGVELQVRRARAAMAAAGDGGAPLLISEIGVASAASSPTSFDRGLRGQARFLRQALGLLVAKRRPWRIAGVDWFSWEDGARPDPHCAFCEHAGLLRRDGRPKPAWHAYRHLAGRTQLPGVDRFNRPR
jgi:polysaccharide biosynthesis protein PslG